MIFAKKGGKFHKVLNNKTKNKFFNKGCYLPKNI